MTNQVNKMDIKLLHEIEIEKIGIPKWLHNIKCPFCQVPMPLKSIRRISFWTSFKNFGDVSVEFYCEKCCQMDTIYYQEVANSIKEFVNKINGTETVEATPILERELMKRELMNISLMEKMETANEQSK